MSKPFQPIVPDYSAPLQSRALVRNTPVPRGPQRVRRDPRDSFRALAEDLAAAEELISSLAMSEQEAWALADAVRASTRELVSLLSHELRNPLQAIFGYTELLEEGIHGKLNADQLTDVMRIQESQSQLLAQLNTVLTRLRAERLASPDRH
jgi:signal transduction histidine kinase